VIFAFSDRYRLIDSDYSNNQSLLAQVLISALTLLTFEILRYQNIFANAIVNTE